MKTFKKVMLSILVSIVTLLILWGIAELALHVYMQSGSLVTILLMLFVLILFVMALGIISGLVVDRIMSNYEDPYGK